MPQPRRQPAAPPPSATAAPRPASTGAASTAAATPPAAAAAAAVPVAGSGIASAAAAAAAAQALGKVTAKVVTPSRETVAAAVQTLLEAVQTLFRQRRATFAQYVAEVARQQMPGAPVERVAQLAAEEVNREVEFQRKAIQRLETELPKAFGEPDPTARAAAVAKILEREKRYLRQREEAAAQRIVAALEFDLLRISSPDGAYWQLSPLVREHCPFCLAMGGKFWPWKVLDMPGMHLPAHHGCRCRLLGLDEAMSQGLMDADQIPEESDAMRRAQALMAEVRRLQETLAPEELEETVAELEALRVLDVQEASKRQQLRFAVGTVKGGQFMPKRGGSAGKPTKREELEALRELVRGESPAKARAAKRGRVENIKGVEVTIPQATHWSEQIKGTTYKSPAGGTSVYRDGVLMHGDHPDFADAWQFPADPGTKGVPLADREPGTTTLAALKPNPMDTIPDYTGIDLKLGKGAGGSQGARWATAEDGSKWLVKSYGGDRDRIATELLANALYRAMGARVAEAGTWGAPGLPDWTKVPDVSLPDEPDLPKLTGKQRMSTGVIVREADGRVWVYEPKGHFGGYEHTFPKGGLEPELSPQQNALKELWEETGLHARIVDYVGDYQGDTGVSRYYMAVRTGGTPHEDDDTPYKPGGSETAKVKLLAPDEVEQALNRNRDKAILKDVLAKGIPEETAHPGPDTLPPATDVPALTYQALDGTVEKWDVPSRELGEHYMTDALLANWDFIGLTQDNVLWTEDGPARLDQGGTLTYRAMGSAKPFGPVPTEVWTMNSPKGGQGFGRVRVSGGMMRAQAEKIGDTLTDARIDKLVDQAPYADQDMREHVRQALKDRVSWMRKFADDEEQIPAPLEGAQARTQMGAWQESFDPFPEQYAALDDFTNDDVKHTAVQEHLRSGKPAKDASKPVQETVRELDSLLRQMRTDDDVTLYRGLSEGMPTENLPGRTMSEKGYLELTTSYANASSSDTVMELLVPSGARALYVPAVEGIEEGAADGAVPDQRQVLLPRGSRVQVVGVEKRGRRTVVQGVVVWS